ncbi:MAG TPA: hypothetical protein VIH66_01165 [Gammaproteobacteria bacterium]
MIKDKPDMGIGGSHDFMIKVEQDGKVLTKVVMNTKVVYPDDSSGTGRS